MGPKVPGVQEIAAKTETFFFRTLTGYQAMRSLNRAVRNHGNVTLPVRGEFINPDSRRWFNWKKSDKVGKA
jgi:hypothetical protein